MFKVMTLPHGWQVLATYLLCGAIAMGAYGISEAGFGEAAATILTAFALCFIRLVLNSAESKLARGVLSDFAETVDAVSTFRREAGQAVNRRPLAAKALLALGYGFGFFGLHAVVAWLFGFLENPWLAGAVGLAFSAVVTSPVLFRQLFASFRTDDQPHDPTEASA